MFGLMLILTLVVTGGVIAYIGDKVGTKVGKKKLSLFGLRPKHTSVLVAIATGVCISLLTLAVLAAASENVRTALFGMEKLTRSLSETRGQLAAAEQALQSSQQARLDIEKHNEELVVGTRELEGNVAALQAQSVELERHNTTLANANKKLLAENSELTRQSEQLQEGLLIMRESDIIYRAGEVLASGVVKCHRDDADVREDMAELIAAANAQVARKTGSEDKRNEIWVYHPEYDEAVTTISEGKGNMVVRIVAAGNLVAGEPVRASIQLFPSTIVYPAGELVLSRPVDLKSDQHGEAESFVMRFLQDVNKSATERGMIPDPIRGSIGVMEGSQFYDLVAQLMARRTESCTLDAYAATDTDTLGPLRLAFKLKP